MSTDAIDVGAVRDALRALTRGRVPVATAGDVAEHLGADYPAVQRAIDELQRAGDVQRLELARGGVVYWIGDEWVQDPDRAGVGRGTGP